MVCFSGDIIYLQNPSTEFTDTFAYQNPFELSNNFEKEFLSILQEVEESKININIFFNKLFYFLNVLSFHSSIIQQENLINAIINFQEINNSKSIVALCRQKLQSLKINTNESHPILVKTLNILIAKRYNKNLSINDYDLSTLNDQEVEFISWLFVEAKKLVGKESSVTLNSYFSESKNIAKELFKSFKLSKESYNSINKIIAKTILSYEKLSKKNTENIMNQTINSILSKVLEDRKNIDIQKRMIYKFEEKFLQTYAD